MVCDRDQARRGGGAAQRIHPPGEILVRVLAEHGDHDVPPPSTELAHGAWEVRDGLDLGAALTDPLPDAVRSEEHTSELQSRPHLVCRLLLEKKKNTHRSCGTMAIPV